MKQLPQHRLLQIIIILFLSFILKSNTSELNDSTKISVDIIKIERNLTYLDKNSKFNEDSLVHLIRKTLDLSLKNKYTKGTTYSYYYLGLYYFQRSISDSSIIYFENGLRNVDGAPELNAQFNWNLANLYRITGEYSQALERSLTLKQLVEGGKTEEFNYQVYNLIALSYQTLLEYDLAKRNYEISASKALEYKDEAYAGVVYANIGKLLYEQEDYNEALRYFEKGTKLEKKHGYLSSLANSYTVIGDIYLKLNKLDSTRKYLTLASKIHRKNNNTIGLSYTLLGISKYHFQNNNLKSALSHLNLTIKYASSKQIKSILKDAYKLKAEIHEQKGEYTEAYKALSLFQKYYNELYDVKEINKAKALEQRLIQQEKETQLFELELEKQKTINTLLLIVVILSVLVGAIAIAFLIHSYRSNKALKRSKQKAEESDKLKSKFLQTISHEIRTPLNGIIGFSDMILTNNLSDQELKDISEHIHKNSYDLTSTIENLVDIAHLTTNQYSINTTQFELDHFLNNIQNLVEENILLKNKAELQLIFDHPIHIKINTDKQILQKTVLHLIKNAISYTHKGYVRVGCNISESMLNIFIKDTGVGIPKEKIEVIFSPFQQADENINIKVGGTGLGLSIVSKFIDLLDGEIRVESKLNVGSTFYLSIPIK